MTRPYDRVDQFHQSVDAGDAITGEMLSLRSVLRGMGYDSDVYAERVGAGCESEVLRLADYRPARRQLMLWHFSIGVDCFERIATNRHDIAVVYHNITPPEFITEPLSNFYLHLGRQQLRELPDLCVGAIADSNYNRRELLAAGFARADVLPVWADGRRFRPAASTAERRSADWLFVGRLIPNKRQLDLVKAFAVYQRNYDPAARLILVGNTTYREYVDAIRREIADQGLAGRVELLGKVEDRELLEVMWSSGAYVSLSEHEGFGVPLLEAMAAGMSVLAVGSAAVAETMGSAGVLLANRSPEVVAEVAASLRSDHGLLERVLASQERRVEYFENFDRVGVLADVIYGCSGGRRPLRFALDGPASWVEASSRELGSEGLGSEGLARGGYADVAITWSEAAAREDVTTGVVGIYRPETGGGCLVTTGGEEVSLAAAGGWSRAVELLRRKSYVPRVALVSLGRTQDESAGYAFGDLVDVSVEMPGGGGTNLATELEMSVVDVIHVVVESESVDQDCFARIVAANSDSKGIITRLWGNPTSISARIQGSDRQLLAALADCDFVVVGSGAARSILVDAGVPEAVVVLAGRPEGDLVDLYREAAGAARARRGLRATARRYTTLSASAVPESE